MTERFADHARRLAGATGRLLGWPPHWFWPTTPAELTALFTPADQPDAGVSRAELERMMEHDSHG